MFDLFGLDLFNKGKLQRARWEYKRMQAQRDELRTELEEVYSERAKAVNMMVNALAEEREVSKKLVLALHASDKKRKELCKEKEELLAKLDEMREKLLVAEFYMRETQRREKILRGAQDDRNAEDGGPSGTPAPTEGTEDGGDDEKSAAPYVTVYVPRAGGGEA